MKKSIRVGIIVVAGTILFTALFTLINPKMIVEYREYQHILNSDANSAIGTTEVEQDGKIDESFETHLPLVVIDLKGNTIPNIYGFSADGTGRVYTAEGQENPDPWAYSEVKLIANDNNVNRLTDEATLHSEAKIKLRGMTSRHFQKKQYGIKLMKNGSESEVSVLGMDKDEDWVLSNSIADLSGIRNYTAMNIGGQIVKYTPEVRFCEVVFKSEEEYTYQGLYLLQEKVKQGKGHIDIDDYDEDVPSLSYAICRDRRDETGLTLSTWASDSQLCYGYFTMTYPKEDKLSDNAIKRIEDELSRIEYCLYNDDPKEFLNYSNYLDVDSFVDYFIVNEFFLNYDAGNNSTYYYKNRNGKLANGPIWDFDNCADNYSLQAANSEWTALVEQPWYEQLIKDPKFQKKIVTRYKQLRKTILSDDNLEKFVDDTLKYLGNAIDRDRSRWTSAYNMKHLLNVVTDDDGLEIDRNMENPREEAQRFLDVIYLHANALDDNLSKILESYTAKDIKDYDFSDRTAIAFAGVLAFLIMVVLIIRVLKGDYK